MWKPSESPISSPGGTLCFTSSRSEPSFYTESCLDFRNRLEDFPPAPTTRTEISPRQLRHSTRTTEKHPYLLSLQISVSNTHLGGVLRIRSLWELVGSKTKHVSYGAWISWATKKSGDQHSRTKHRRQDQRWGDMAIPGLEQLRWGYTFSFKLHSMCWKKQLAWGRETYLK